MITEELQQIFRDSCEKHGIVDDKIIAEITKAGSRLFSIGAGGLVVALGDYSNVAEFVTAYRTSQPRQGVPLKQQLYGQMIEYAKAGNMAGYRRVRKEFAAL